jgi:4-amino-4-deoxy-L-arabinose transferase-like glycosyltransferase
LTDDEAAFGYNAVLLSRTAHDESGRFLPFFVLSLDGQDWRQPVTQYYLTALFKIFSPSVFLLRFSSVLVAITSAVLLYLLSLQLFNRHKLVWASTISWSSPSPSSGSSACSNLPATASSAI